MSTVNTQSTSTTVGSSGQTAESCTGPLNNATADADGRASANSLSNVRDFREFIRFQWLTNTEVRAIWHCQKQCVPKPREEWMLSSPSWYTAVSHVPLGLTLQPKQLLEKPIALLPNDPNGNENNEWLFEERLGAVEWESERCLPPHR
jgi:hypothetical protein